MGESVSPEFLSALLGTLLGPFLFIRGWTFFKSLAGSI